MTQKNTEKPRHLGRGLESLLGPITPLRPGKTNNQTESNERNLSKDKDLREPLQEVPIASVYPNPYQPRKTWDQRGLNELADSIRTNGVIQPIIVRPVGKNYQVIAGERRLRAAKIAGLQNIPAIIRDATDEQLLEIALVENIHRTNLNPIERAKAYQEYLTTFSLRQSDVAQRLGENRSVIANHLRLLDLPQELKQMLIENKLSMGHARAILALPTDEIRRKLANRALAGRLSVREVERLVRKQIEKSKTSVKTGPDKEPHILDLEDIICRHLGTKVRIDTTKTGRRGRIVIEFYSIDEFDRITGRLGINNADKT